MRTDGSSLRHDPVSMSEARRAFAAHPVAAFLATGFGSGLSPVAPGTAGSLVGLVLGGISPAARVAHGSSLGSPVGLLMSGLARRSRSASRVSGPVCRALGSEDPGCIVIDEVAGQLVACARRAPRPPRGRRSGRWVAAFVLFRFFDVVKPLGRSARIQDLPGGWGIVADDVAGGLCGGGRSRRLGWLAAWAEDLTLSPEEGAVEPTTSPWRATRPGASAARRGYFCRVRTEAALARVLGAASADGAAARASRDGLEHPGGRRGLSRATYLRLEGDVPGGRDRGRARLRRRRGARSAASARRRRARELSGIEAISGIPSSIGGAVRINAGAYGGEIFDVLETVRLVSRAGQRRAAAAGADPARLPLDRS